MTHKAIIFKQTKDESKIDPKVHEGVEVCFI